MALVVMVAAFNVASLGTYDPPPTHPIMKVCTTCLHLVFCEDIDPLSVRSFLKDAQVGHPIGSTNSIP